MRCIGSIKNCHAEGGKAKNQINEIHLKKNKKEKEKQKKSVGLCTAILFKDNFYDKSESGPHGLNEICYC